MRPMLTGVMVAVVAAMVLLATAEECPLPFRLVGEHCYHFSRDPASWSDARIFCQTLLFNVSADLALFDLTCGDYRHLFSHMEISGYEGAYWVGGSELALGEYWTWLDGRLIDLLSNYWSYDHPVTNTDHNCALLDREKLGYQRHALFSENCDLRSNYICETEVHA